METKTINIDKVEKEYGNLSEFIGRGVELYRSIDEHNTAIYFTEHDEVPYEDRENLKSFFEVLSFELDGGNHHVYVRYPNENDFVELYGSCIMNGRGTMNEGEGENLYSNQFSRKIKINKHDDYAVMFIGALGEFNFLKRVGYLEKKNPFQNGDTDKYHNYNEVKKSLELKYLKLPTSLYKCEYSYVIKEDENGDDLKVYDNNNFYIITFHPSFHYDYNNQKLFAGTINNMKAYTITDFKRYRDGGTTFITCKDDLGVEHILYSPSEFVNVSMEGKDMIKHPTWDKSELKEMSSFDANSIAEKLGIILSESVKYKEGEE